jgi:hypothetical protein
MSRLNSFIRRVSAQRDCLNMAKDMIADVPGPILELGLGNGRTFDHLRELFPDREIFVFDQRVAAHPDCIPDEDHMIIGNVTETLKGALNRIGAQAALAHCDIGSSRRDLNAKLVSTIAPLVDALMAPGGLVCSDQEYSVSNWEAQPLPEGVNPGRYYINRVTR